MKESIKYNFKQIESKWQRYWSDHNSFSTPKPSKQKTKKYLLAMFPYPSGEGLHVGHVEVYTGTDVLARFHRMNGQAVLHPMGWDSFGLPAENYAIKKGIHPKETTERNIKRYKEQLNSLGYSYDWSKELSTSSPEYYRWTQWMFLQLYHAGLAYQAEAAVNWCPSCQTVLANEQVVAGACERCGTAVEQKKMNQWFFKITDYAEELLTKLDDLKWPESIKSTQRNWIGKSEGTQMKFKAEECDINIEVFTTRIDTLYGATYLVIAPEHPDVMSLTAKGQHQAVIDYQQQSRNKSELERIHLDKNKTGVFTGSYATNPINGDQLPIWVADYIVMGYGTGAIMAVPAHDERDLEFALKYRLPIRPVVWPWPDKSVSYLMGAEDISDQELQLMKIEINHIDDNDRFLIIPNKYLKDYEDLIINKLTPGYWNEYIGSETIFIFKDKDSKIKRLQLTPDNNSQIDELASRFTGEKFELKDVWSWLISNPSYNKIITNCDHGWLINSEQCDGLNYDQAVKEITKKVNAEQRSLYRLRDWLISRQRYWGAPIPIIYCDRCGVVPVPEEQLPVLLPDDVDFKPHGHSPLADSKSFNQVTCPKCGARAKRETDTMDTFVCSSWYFLRYPSVDNNHAAFSKQETQEWLPVDRYIGGAEHAVLHLLYARFFTKFLRDQGKLSFDEPFLELHNAGVILGSDHQKMSKSKGNVVNPDDVVAEYGADVLRIHELFLGPYSDEKPWSTDTIKGAARFLEGVFIKAQQIKQENVTTSSEKAKQVISQSVAKVTTDTNNLHFNTAIAQLMTTMNAIRAEHVSVFDFEQILLLLAPYAPHLASELWSIWHQTDIHQEPWPKQTELVESDMVTIAIQVNGKLRGTIEISPTADDEQLRLQAEQNDRVQTYIKDKHIDRVIVVPKKVVNFIVTD